MKNKQLVLILQILVLAGCNKERQSDVITDNAHQFEQSNQIHDSQIEIPDSIHVKEWTTDGNSLLVSTDNPGCMFALVPLDSLAITETFGKKGKGEGEFIMPHVVGCKGNGFIIVDNGNKSILKVEGTKVAKISGTNESVIFNQPHMISVAEIGYMNLSPSQLQLNKYRMEDGGISTIVTFPEDGTLTDNSDLYDFVWDVNAGNIVTAHLYADKFSIRKTDANWLQTAVNHVQGDNNFNQERIVYSDIACGDFIYLLCQTNVDIENFSGNSVIEKYDYDGNPVEEYVYDGIIDKIILDQDRERMFFTSTSDENIHYFDL